MTKANTAKELTDCRPDTIADRVDGCLEPIVLRGLVDEWPVVRAAKESANAAAEHIRQFYNGDRVTVFTSSPDTAGRVGYTDDVTSFSFERGDASLNDVLQNIFMHIDDAAAPGVYVGSTLLDRWFPGFRASNDLQMGDRDLLASIWIGNRIRVAAHFDVASNIACCVAGRRRFTLFPPEQLENLYVGPWDVTPAGQAISLVDFENPDFEKFPRFRDALDAAYVVDLAPGDALYLPSMWWHHVEGLDGFNVLVNYWWRNTPAFMGSPQVALKAAMLTLYGLPPEQRAAWKNIFDYYVFEQGPESLAHIPEHARGMLELTDDTAARRLRADLLNQLNR